MPTLLIWEDDTGQTQSARFDILESESHESTLVVTDHPVEDGSDVTDHARTEPERLSLVGFVSNTPLFTNPGVEEIASFETIDLDLPPKPSPFAPGEGRFNVTGGIASAVEGLFSSAPSAVVLVQRPPVPIPGLPSLPGSSGNFTNRVRNMYDALREAHDARRLVRVETPIREYENMLIEHLGVPRTAEDGDGATFTVDLRSIRIVQSEIVESPIPAEVRGLPLVSQGSKSSQAAENDAAKAERAQSIAARLFDGAGGALSDIVGL